MKPAFIKVVEEEEAVGKKTTTYCFDLVSATQQFVMWDNNTHVQCAALKPTEGSTRFGSYQSFVQSQDLFQLSSESRWIRGINPKNSTKVPSGALGYLLVVLFLTIRLKSDTK